MFRLHVWYEAKDKETIRKFYDEVKKAGVREATKSEDGCLCYDYYFSVEKENVILLLEDWKDKESQQVHMSSPHLKTLGEIKEKYKVTSTLEEI